MITTISTFTFPQLLDICLGRIPNADLKLLDTVTPTIMHLDQGRTTVQYQGRCCVISNPKLVDIHGAVPIALSYEGDVSQYDEQVVASILRRIESRFHNTQIEKGK